MPEIERIDVAVTISPIEARDGALARPTGAILSELPPGAVPSAGFPFGEGEWLLSRTDLDGLTVSVSRTHADDFSPHVTAFYEDTSGAVTSYDKAPFEAVPVFGQGTGAAGADQPIPLDVSIAVAGLGAGDILYDVTVTGVPDGAKLTAGIDNGDGSWTLLPGQLDDVGLVVPNGFAGTLTLAYSAIGIGGGGEVHSHNAAADFWLQGSADPPDGISFGPGFGHEHFVGHGSDGDVVHLVGIGHGPSEQAANADDWTLILDDPLVAATPTENGLQFEGEVSGSIVLGDGSELTFVDVTRIDW